MEELRSTEVLDKEIRDDARKKAERILEQAEEKSRELLESVSSRVAESQKEAEKALSERLLSREKNTNASLPLEKQRYLVSYINDSILDAVNAYFERNGEECRLKVIESMLKDVLENLSKSGISVKVKARVIDCDLSKTEALLKKILGTGLVSVEKGMPLEGENMSGLKYHDGVILTSEDESFTCRLTIDEKIRSVLDEYSESLAAALFGGRIPE